MSTEHSVIDNSKIINRDRRGFITAQKIEAILFINLESLHEERV